VRPVFAAAVPPPITSADTRGEEKRETRGSDGSEYWVEPPKLILTTVKKTGSGV